MRKILLTADAHIARHKKSSGRLSDCLEALEWAFQTALNNQIYDFVFAGDLFQDKERIDTLSYHLTFDILSKYSDLGIRIFLLLGNHDLFFHDRWDVNSVKPFSAIKNVTVIDTPTTLNIQDFKIDFLPYTKTPLEHLEFLHGNKYLIGHLAIDGAKLNSYHYADVVVEHDGEMVTVNSSKFCKWNKVFLGHYHAPQVIGNIEYVGSPLQLSWGEKDQDKHVVILNLDNGDQEYIKNNFSPKHLEIKNNFNSDKIKNNFIKIITELPESEVIKMRREVAAMEPGTLEIVAKNKEFNKNIEFSPPESGDELEMINKWIDTCDIKGLSKEKLKKLAAETTV